MMREVGDRDRVAAALITAHDGWPEASSVVDQGLEASNTQAAPLHEVTRMACLARCATTGAVMGGALGRAWGPCGELQELWVEPELRRLGLGARLIQAFEDLAARRGCQSIHLETFSFQAPRLYASLGYRTQYERRDFPHGIIKFHMLKTLPASAAGRA